MKRKRNKLSAFVMCLVYVLFVVLTAAGCDSGTNNETGQQADTSSEEQQQMNGTGAQDEQGQTHQTGTQPTSGNGESQAESTQGETRDNTPGEQGGATGENGGESGENTGYELNFTDAVRTVIELEYNPTTYSAQVQGYTVNSDLSNIENLEQFGEFTQLQAELLSRNGFFVTPTKEEQMFYIYEKNEYLKIPSFITTDSVLQVYHVFYDYSLRVLEAQKLLGVLEELTVSMLEKSIYLYNEIQNTDVKAEMLVITAYFGVAQLALQKELPEEMPAGARELAESEFELVTSAAGFKDSFLFPFMMDYSQYIPRGHYTRNEDLERYFKAVMWYGQVPFNVYANEETGELDMQQITRALLMTYAMFLEKGGPIDSTLWENIYDPTVFYVGKTDDLTVYDFKSLILDVYGTDPDINMFMDDSYSAELKDAVDRLPEPKIKHKYVGVNIPSGKQFRFMGQRYIPDSEILQELVDPFDRPMPMGLDVMAVLGSDHACDMLVDRYKVPEQWDGYLDSFNMMRDKFSKVDPQTWRSNMYYGWLWVLKSQLEPFGEGYPSFMRNEAWLDKSLNTALASWAELRHDTILYGKQSGAECGGDAPPEVIGGYVEPNIELYERLLWLTRYSRKNLSDRQILPVDLENRMQNFEDKLQFLINCSVKQLSNEELTMEEYNTLLTYGAYLEYLTSTFASDAGERVRWFEITSETDKNIAVVADVHTAGSTYLEEAVGPAHEIYVVVPIAGKLYLARGAVFSYYEFANNKRLTDEEWQQMIKEGQQPERPEWTKSFETEEKEEIPVPREPYRSGC